MYGWYDKSLIGSVFGRCGSWRREGGEGGVGCEFGGGKWLEVVVGVASD